MKQAAREPKVTRRSFLGYTIGAVGAFIASTLGASSAIFASSPLLNEKRGAKVTLGPVAGFKVDVPKLVDFQVTRKDGWIVEDITKSLWVIRKGEATFDVLSGRCTHLGCAFSWKEDKSEFFCPCHNGRFAIDGQVVGGPPPRALDKLENWVEGGKLVANYQEFRLGVTEKVEV